MGITAALSLGAIGNSVYQGVAANQARQKAKGQLASLLTTAPNAGADQQKANSAALDAQQRARTKALSSQGQGSTILTGPQGVSTPPPARTTLLGL